MLAASAEPNLSLPLNRDLKNNDNFFNVFELYFLKFELFYNFFFEFLFYFSKTMLETIFLKFFKFLSIYLYIY